MLILAIITLSASFLKIFANVETTDPSQCGHDLCLENLGETYVNDNQYFSQQNCFCDNDCAKYGDCCLDAIKGKQKDKVFDCIKIPGLSHGIYMISKCPSWWTNNGVKNFCEDMDTNDPFLTVPVYVKEKNIIYKNIYCAVCNREEEENLISWTIKIKCFHSKDENIFTINEFQNIVYNKSQNRWIIANPMPSSCLMLTTLPKELTRYRRCKQPIETCGKNWTDQTVEMKCHSINAYRYYNENTKQIVYKNTHCAICNNIEPKRLQCSDSVVKMLKNTPLNYSIIWSMNFPYASLTRDCGFGEVYDSFMHTCRNVLCLDCLTNFKDLGRLQSSEEFVTKGNLKCQLHLLPQFHYKIQENGIWSEEMRKTIPSNLYFLDQNKTLYICESQISDQHKQTENLNDRSPKNIGNNMALSSSSNDTKIKTNESNKQEADIRSTFLEKNLKSELILNNNENNHVNKLINLQNHIQNDSSKKEVIKQPTSIPLYHQDKFCFKIALEPSEITNFNFHTKSFFVPMLNRTFVNGEYTLDERFHPIICDPINIFYNNDKSCWEIALHSWAYKYQNDSLFVDIVNKLYMKNEYSFNARKEPVICISVNPQNNINDDIVCVKMLIPQNEITMQKNSVYVHKFNTTFNSSQYFIDKDGRVSICLAPLSQSCFRIVIQKEDFELQSNNTIFVPYMNMTFQPSQYEITDTGVSICEAEILHSKPRYTSTQGLITIVGLGISITCLALHLLAYFFMADQSHLGCKNVAILASTLMMAQILWLLHPVAIKVVKLCMTIAILGHFMYLASFSWMGIISYDIWRTFSRKYLHQYSRTSEQFRFLKYSLCAWSVPISVVTVSILVDFLVPMTEFHPCYQCGSCWIYQRKALFVFFVLPLAIILLGNIVLFVLTLSNIYKAFKAARKARRQEIHEVLITCKLAILMGLTWIIGFVQQKRELQYLFIILNSLQGVFIFIGFTFTKNIRRNLEETVTKMSVHRQLSNSSSMRTEDTDLSAKRPLSFKSSQPICTDPAAGFPRSKTPNIHK